MDEPVEICSCTSTRRNTRTHALSDRVDCDRTVMRHAPNLEEHRGLLTHHNPLARRVPAAALTAYARSEDRVKALRAGLKIHLAEPIDPAELVTAVAALVRRSVQKASTRSSVKCDAASRVRAATGDQRKSGTELNSCRALVYPCQPSPGWDAQLLQLADHVLGGGFRLDGLCRWRRFFRPCQCRTSSDWRRRDHSARRTR